MKKITAVMVMSLAMVVVMTFTCYADTIYGCYQKSSGQVRALTSKKDTCRPHSEVGPFILGGEIPEVPIICAGYVDLLKTPPFTSSCISNVDYINDPGQFQISLTKQFVSPVCVFYVYPILEVLDPWPNPWVKYEYSATPSSSMTVTLRYGEDVWDGPFNFICTEP